MSATFMAIQILFFWYVLDILRMYIHLINQLIF